LRWFSAQSAAFVLLALLVVAPALAQQAAAPENPAGQAVLIVDQDKALNESAPGRALRALLQERRTIQLQATAERDKAMEAEEIEIARIRDGLSREEFEKRLQEFDQKVRQARRENQEAIQTMQAENDGARRKLVQALHLILRDILQERGATVLLNAQTVVMARGDVDVTSEVIERLSKVQVDFDLPTNSAGDGG